MDVCKRLFRRPASTALWIVLLMLASLILGVAASLYASAKGVPDALEKRQTTIALQNVKLEEQEDGSFSINSQDALLFEEDIDYLRSLPQVKDVDFRYISGAYIENLHARIGLTDFFGNYQDMWKINDSYKNVLLIGTVESVWEAPFNSVVNYDLSAFGHEKNVGEKYCCALVNVEDVISMHPDYPLFPEDADAENRLYTGKVRVRFNVFDEEEGPFFQVGSRYAIYGEYNPTSSSRDQDPMPDEGVPFAPHIFYNYPAGGFFSCYAEGDTLAAYRSEYDDSASFSFGPGMSEEPPVTKLLTRENRMPVVTKWNGTAQELLSDPYWGELAKRNEMYLHSFPVLGTNCIESMYGFVTDKTKIVEGRTFTEQEYQSGAKVLILNETAAHSAGLSVGDTINVCQFRIAVGDEQGNISVSSNALSPERVGQNNPGLGKSPFFNEMPRDGEPFTIVGLYRQENEWEDSLCSFTPNTIFMPRGAQIEDALGGPSKVTGTRQVTRMMYHIGANGALEESGEETFEEEIIDPGLANGLFMSIILKNGSIDSFLERIAQESTDDSYVLEPGKVVRSAAAGLSGHTFLCFDQGYDNVKDSIGAIMDSAKKLALIALFGAVLIFAAYMLLYQGLERKTLGIMRSLGAKKPVVRRYLFISGLILAALGIVLGTVLSGAVSGIVSRKLAELTVSQAKLTGNEELFLEMLTEGGIPVRDLALIALAEIGAVALALWLQALLTANKKIRKLMGK